MAVSLQSGSIVNSKRSGSRKPRSVFSSRPHVKTMIGLTEREEDTPESASIDDFDYFDMKRQQRLDKIMLKERAEKQSLSILNAARNFAWRLDGINVVSSLRDTLGKYGTILTPYNKKQLCHEELLKLFSEMAVLPSTTYIRGWVSTKLLRCTCPGLWGKKPFNSIQRLRHKFEVMKDVVTAFKLSKPFLYEPRRQISEVKVVRHLFRVYQQMQLDRNSMVILEKKRQLCRLAQIKLDLIRRTKKACLYIYECKSIQHDNPRFCGHCGVVWVGGSINGVPYVKSISRENGVATLQPLEFEIETLEEEERVQVSITHALELERDTLCDSISNEVAAQIQLWWIIVIAFKRYKWYIFRRECSFFQWRIRKLVQMKKEVDLLIREPNLDIAVLTVKYGCIYFELNEYIMKQQRLKRDRILLMSFVLRERLSRLVGAARERRRLAEQEEEEARRRRGPVPLAARPIVLRRVLPETSSSAKWVCCRPQCKGRAFLSTERYSVHMAVHSREDQARQDIIAENARRKETREIRERMFVNLVKQSGRYLSASCGDDVSDEEASTNDHVSTLSGNHIDNAAVVVSSGVATAAPPYEDESGTAAASASTSLVSSAVGLLDMKDLEKFLAFNTNLLSPKHFAPKKHLLVTSISSGGNGFHSKYVPHIFTLNRGNNATSMYSLELVSKVGDVVVAPSVITLDKPVTRFGIDLDCEVHFGVRGAVESSGVIAPVHCLLYCPMAASFGNTTAQSTVVDDGDGAAAAASSASHTGARSSSTVFSGLNSKHNSLLAQEQNVLTVVDNYTAYGTYVVSSSGVRRVAHKLTAGVSLAAGVLLCIGVKQQPHRRVGDVSVAAVDDAQHALSAEEAGNACVVYRVRVLQ